MLTNMPSNVLLSPPKTRVGTFSNRREFLALGVVLVLFLGVCTCIHGRYIPWGDEVQFVDPAANLYYKVGFVSTEWSNQTDRTFWSGNAPAYPALLYIAFRTFHFSAAVARSVNYVTMALAALFLWSAVLRGRLVTNLRTRWLMLAFVLTGYGGYACYANIRYDCLSFLECSLALLAYTVTRPVIRNGCLFVLGAAMVLTNLQLPQYAVALVLIVTYAYSLGSATVWKLGFLYLGMVAGGVALLVVYASHSGSLDAFRVTIQQQAGQSRLENSMTLDTTLNTIPVCLRFYYSSWRVLRSFGCVPTSAPASPLSPAC